MKKLLQNYWHPTPKKWRIIGDSILATGTAVTGGGMLAFDTMKDVFGNDVTKWIIAGSFMLATAGKFLTNLFKEETPAA